MRADIQLNAESAEKQGKMLAECIDLVEKCLKTSKDLREGQTALMWTADGKSVALTSALEAKYAASVDWLKDLAKQLKHASEALSDAVDSTTLLDETQKAQFQPLIYRANSIIGPNKPMAV